MIRPYFFLDDNFFSSFVLDHTSQIFSLRKSVEFNMEAALKKENYCVESSEIPSLLHMGSVHDELDSFKRLLKTDEAASTFHYEVVVAETVKEAEVSDRASADEGRWDAMRATLTLIDSRER
jgi:hypothetical protein